MLGEEQKLWSSLFDLSFFLIISLSQVKYSSQYPHLRLVSISYVFPREWDMKFHPNVKQESKKTVFYLSPWIYYWNWKLSFCIIQTFRTDEIMIWILAITIIVLDIIHRPAFYVKHNISEIEFCLRAQVEPTWRRKKESSLRNVVISIKGRTMDNVQN
jgi:hypothetical protein